MNERMFGRKSANSTLRSRPLPSHALSVRLDQIAIVSAPAILVVTYAAKRKGNQDGAGLGYPQPREFAEGTTATRGGLRRLIATGTGMYGLTVRFDLVPGTGKDFDSLVEATLEGVRDREPGTLLYLCHQIDGEPDSRVFYELYRDKAAFEEHERQPHTRRFLDERTKFLARPPRVIRLSSASGKGMELA